MDEDEIKLEKRVRRHLKIRSVCRKLSTAVLISIPVYIVISDIFMPNVSIEAKRNTIHIGMFVFAALSLCVTILARCPVCKKWIKTNSYYSVRGLRVESPHPGTDELPNICPHCGTNFGKYDEDGWA